jgi:hypothetical protein
MACSFALSLFISQSWEMTDASTMHQKNKQNYMIIRGIVDEKDNILLYPLYSVSDSGLDWPDGKGPFTLEVLDGAGRLVKFYRFGTSSLKIIKTDGSDKYIESGLFAFKIFYDDAAQQMVVKKNEMICIGVGVKRNSQSPTISIIKPTSGDILTGKISIQWSGFHKEGNSLHYLLEYSADNGHSWIPVSGLITETFFVLDTAIFAPSSHIILGIICTDGFNTVRSEVDIIVRNPVKVQYVIPYDNEKNVTLTPTIYVRFTNYVKENQINEKAFVLFERGSGYIKGDVFYDPDSRIGKFIPRNPLKPDTSYTVRLSSEIEDKNANTLMLDYLWSFTTKSVIE